MELMSEIIKPPPGFRTTRFWKDCAICMGFGTLPAHHPMASDENGTPTKVPYPTVDGGHTGEIMVDAHKSYCKVCRGSGIMPK
jgi:hypothetical protein